MRSSCETDRDAVQLPVPVSVYTRKHARRVCVLLNSTEKTKVYTRRSQSPMDRSGIATLVGFRLEENE